MNLTLDCSMIKTTIGTENFAACGNYRPHFTKITKIWQDRSPIRKSSIILRSRKTLFNLLHPLLFNPASQNFLYGLCGWRFLRWRQLAHAISCLRALHHRWHHIASVTNLQRIVGYIRKVGDWNTGIQQKKGGICIVLIWSPRIGPPFFSSRFMDRNTQVSSSSLFPAKR